MYAKIDWLTAPDVNAHRAGCVRVHPGVHDPAYFWTCTVRDDGRGGLEFHGVTAIGGNKAEAVAIRTALYVCALREGFRTVVWWRLRGVMMEARVFRLDPAKHVHIEPSIFDWAAAEIRTLDRVVKLTPFQADLLSALTPNGHMGGDFTSTDRLVSRLWGHDFEPDNPIATLRVQICKLRRRLDGTGILIESRHSMGYRVVCTSLRAWGENGAQQTGSMGDRKVAGGNMSISNA